MPQIVSNICSISKFDEKYILKNLSENITSSENFQKKILEVCSQNRSKTCLKISFVLRRVTKITPIQDTKRRKVKNNRELPILMKL